MIQVVGHLNPDSDAICSAWVTAKWLLPQQEGRNGKPAFGQDDTDAYRHQPARLLPSLYWLRAVRRQILHHSRHAQPEKQLLRWLENPLTLSGGKP
ncbi:hypothetical protein [Mangrovibacter phragmitis]|uniref:hypothetical protein n=1 Tax=Mangrovibacter phragmitis TaxID=1691903 RepID=UPI00336AB428